jgi:hypothetical protein
VAVVAAHGAPRAAAAREARAPVAAEAQPRRRGVRAAAPRRCRQWSVAGAPQAVQRQR